MLERLILLAFLQTPDVVYILYEYGPSWRPVWLNKPHPPADELDTTLWGHSIGRYEGSDTFVVDTVGLSDKTWLDDVGRPHTDKLHVIERYRRVDKNARLLEYECVFYLQEEKYKNAPFKRP